MFLYFLLRIPNKNPFISILISSTIDTMIIPCRLKVSQETWRMISKNVLPPNIIDKMIDNVLFSIGRPVYTQTNPSYYTEDINHGRDPSELSFNNNTSSSSSSNMNQFTVDDSEMIVESRPITLNQRCIQDIFIGKQSKTKIYVDNIQTCIHKLSGIESVKSFSICMKIKDPKTFNFLDDCASTFGQWSIENYRVISNLDSPSL